MSIRANCLLEISQTNLPGKLYRAAWKGIDLLSIFINYFASSLLILKPNALSLFGSVLDALYSEKFTISRIRLMSLGNEGGLLDPQVVDEATRASIQNGPSIVFEVLKTSAVQELQKLINEKIPTSSPISDLFYAPKDFKTAQTVRSFSLSFSLLYASSLSITIY